MKKFRKWKFKEFYPQGCSLKFKKGSRVGGQAVKFSNEQVTIFSRSLLLTYLMSQSTTHPPHWFFDFPLDGLT